MHLQRLHGPTDKGDLAVAFHSGYATLANSQVNRSGGIPARERKARSEIGAARCNVEEARDGESFDKLRINYGIVILSGANVVSAVEGRTAAGAANGRAATSVSETLHRAAPISLDYWKLWTAIVWVIPSSLKLQIFFAITSMQPLSFCRRPSTISVDDERIGRRNSS